MIVRILDEGQYRLSDDAFARVNAIDDRVQAASDAGDRKGFRDALHDLVVEIRASGEPLAPEEFVGSDAIVPAPDTSLEDARALLGVEGLIPD
jgi:hypothetical protein